MRIEICGLERSFAGRAVLRGIELDDEVTTLAIIGRLVAVSRRCCASWADCSSRPPVRSRSTARWSTIGNVSLSAIGLSWDLCSSRAVCSSIWVRARTSRCPCARCTALPKGRRVAVPMSCLSASACPRRRTRGRRSSRAASSSAWPSRVPWRLGRVCCCSMSPRARSIRSTRARCSTSCATCATRARASSW